MEMNAYAKINLSLDITGRREDGYHTLDTVMQSVTLADRVTAVLTETGEITLTCTKPHIPTDGKNTAFRAAQLFLDSTGLDFGVKIHIEKHIPDEAGLGGGSADAAAVLRLLNRMAGEPLVTAELLYIGMQIGADVPFCVLNGTQRCGGIGEQMVPLRAMPACGLVLVKPPVGVSTPEAYRQCDTVPDSGERYSGALTRALERRSLAETAQALGNRFDDALQFPAVREIKEKLCALGALNACMSGSGSAVFGVFETPEKAEEAKTALGSVYGETFTAEPTGGDVI